MPKESKYFSNRKGEEHQENNLYLLFWCCSHLPFLDSKSSSLVPSREPSWYWSQVETAGKSQQRSSEKGEITLAAGLLTLTVGLSAPSGVTWNPCLPYIQAPIRISPWGASLPAIHSLFCPFFQVPAWDGISVAWSSTLYPHLTMSFTLHELKSLTLVAFPVPTCSQGRLLSLYSCGASLLSSCQLHHGTDTQWDKQNKLIHTWCIPLPSALHIWLQCNGLAYVVGVQHLFCRAYFYGPMTIISVWFLTSATAHCTQLLRSQDHWEDFHQFWVTWVRSRGGENGDDGTKAQNSVSSTSHF